jgi:hypothetical protein
MARAAPRTEQLPQEHIEVSSLDKRLAAVDDAVSAEPVPERLVRGANALQDALEIRRQRRNPN